MYGRSDLLEVNTGLTTEAGSPSDMEHHDKANGTELAERRVLFMGLPRSGKSSILSVVFENMLPYNIIGILPTQERTVYHMVTGIAVYDFPGIDDYAETQYSSAVDPAVYAGNTTALVYVVDSQGDIQGSLATLFTIMRVAQAVNERLPIHIFIHKVDGLSEELKQDIQQDIQQRVLKNMGYENLNSAFMNFHRTTIFDESVREALSRVVQRLVPRYSSLENILNSFSTKSGLDKVFLFDIGTKVYLSMDSSPSEPQLYMFSCQTIDAMEDLAELCARDLVFNVDDDEMLMQKTLVGLDSNTKIFIYQVNSYLALLCVGSAHLFRQMSLLEFNSSKVAKAIREILTS
ncbi:GTP-binding protein gtr2 [Coemansia sp. RSA 2703]|nr:GTP-binding protein gtr2 [Coemansia sp. RSA 2703]KAJ2394694.1 GTP-binding protein gtr2 [Coemansia sp. RSA 2603]